jgi:hypothetical protein
MAGSGTPFSTLLLIATLIAVGITAIIYRRRHSNPSAPALLVRMLGIIWWDLPSAIHWSAIPRPFPTFWLDTTFCGVVVVPTALFIVAIQYSHQESAGTRPLSRFGDVTLTMLRADGHDRLVARDGIQDLETIHGL